MSVNQRSPGQPRAVSCGSRRSGRPRAQAAPQRRAEILRLRRVAADAAAAGLFVFPLAPGGKSPIFHSERKCRRRGVCAGGHQKWEQRATREPDQIRRWWSVTPYNVAIACGPSGLLVVDLDLAVDPDSGDTIVDGRVSLQKVEAEHGVVLPATRTVATPSGGEHRYFRRPPGLNLRNTQGRLGLGIDTRAGGGSITAPGSIRPDGLYRVVDDTAIADLPGWLIPLIRPKPRLPDRPAPAGRVGPVGRSSGPVGGAEVRHVTSRSDYLQAVKNRQTRRVEKAVLTTRDNTIHGAALRLARFIGPDQLTDDEVHDAVLAAARCHVGEHDMTEEQVLRAISRGMGFGRHLPIVLVESGDPGPSIPSPRTIR